MKWQWLAMKLLKLSIYFQPPSILVDLIRTATDRCKDLVDQGYSFSHMKIHFEVNPPLTPLMDKAEAFARQHFPDIDRIEWEQNEHMDGVASMTIFTSCSQDEGREASRQWTKSWIGEVRYPESMRVSMCWFLVGDEADDLQIEEILDQMEKEDKFPGFMGRSSTKEPSVEEKKIAELYAQDEKKH
jgi:hypothetical protein